LEAGTRALQDFVKRHNLPAEVLPGQLVGFSRVRYRVLRSPKVALCIIASNKVATLPGRGEVCLVENFVKSIVSKTLYTNYEIVVCHDNNLDLAVTARLDALGCRLLGYPGPSAPFNFAKKTNFAIRHAEAPHAVLLNDDMEVISPDWLSALLEYTQQPAIGAAGGRLLYPDGSIQHAGVAIGINQGAGHLFHGAPGGYVGYNGFTHLVRNCSAVTGACLAMRTAVFEEAGGFDEGFGVDYNDTDFCLTLIERGYRIVYTPYCELYHFEGQSLPRHAQNAREVDRFRQKWVKYVEDDPYYNPNLSRDRLDCAVDSRRSSWRPGVMTRS